MCDQKRDYSVRALRTLSSSWCTHREVKKVQALQRKHGPLFWQQYQKMFNLLLRPGKLRAQCLSRAQNFWGAPNFSGSRNFCLLKKKVKICRFSVEQLEQLKSYSEFYILLWTHPYLQYSMKSKLIYLLMDSETLN